MDPFWKIMFIAAAYLFAVLVLKTVGSRSTDVISLSKRKSVVAVTSSLLLSVTALVLVFVLPMRLLWIPVAVWAMSGVIRMLLLPSTRTRRMRTNSDG